MRRNPYDWKLAPSGLLVLTRPHGRYEFGKTALRYYNRTHTSGMPTSVWVNVHTRQDAEALLRPHDRKYAKNMVVGETWAKSMSVKHNPSSALTRLDASTLAERASRAGWHDTTSAGRQKLLAYVNEMRRRLGRDPFDFAGFLHDHDALSSTLRAFYDSFVTKRNPRYSSGPYTERVKLPKWSVRPSLVEAPAPRIRASFPGMSPTDHEKAIEKAIVHANAAARAYNRTMKDAYKKYGEKGPFISGIGQGHFPEGVKNLLVKQLGAFNKAQDAVGLHYKALGKRTPLYQSEYVNRLVKAGGYGLGRHA